MTKLQRLLAFLSPMLVAGFAYEPVRRYTFMVLAALGALYALALSLAAVPGVVGRVVPRIGGSVGGCVGHVLRDARRIRRRARGEHEAEEGEGAGHQTALLLADAISVSRAHTLSGTLAALAAASNRIRSGSDTLKPTV